MAEPTPRPISPDATVITVDGVCKTPVVTGADCKTVITRAEFERLAAMLSRPRNGMAQQAIPAEAKRQLAFQYSRLLLFAHLAEKQGLQNDPEGKELIHFVRLQALTEELARTLQQKSTPTVEEVRAYYDQHPERFTRRDLRRVVVPLGPQGQNELNKEDLKKLAEDFRQRASDGGDFEALQKEAFEKTGMKNPPRSGLVLMPGQSLPESHTAVYRLKPGEVSQVIEDYNGFYIYKLDSSSVVPLDQTKVEIQELLAGQKAQEAIRKLAESNKVTLNSDYFEPAHQKLSPETSSIQPLAGSAVRADIRSTER